MRNTSTRAKGDKGACDDLFSRIVRAHGECQRCGERDPSKLQAAHIIPRRFNATRHLETNALCLCAGCHIRFTHEPHEFVWWVESLLGKDTYRRLRDRAHEGVKATKAHWKAERARLKARCEEVGA